MSRRRPADWEPLEAVWLTWPKNEKTWPGRFEAIPVFYEQWIRKITESHRVRLLVDPSQLRDLERRFNGNAWVDIIEVPNNDVWIRDYGPQFVIETDPDGESSLLAVDFRYNAWGGKYPPWDLDAAAAKKIASLAGATHVASPLCVEGGALECDGRGRVITTTDCLIDPNRNDATWTSSEIAGHLHDMLGIEEVVWVDGGGLRGDDTDGHIDQLARFLDRENVIVATRDQNEDDEAEGLRTNFLQLDLWAKQTTPTIEIHPIALPPPRKINGQPVPQSYCNFLRLGADRILAPTFQAPTDSDAIGLIEEISGATVEPIDCTDLVWGLGALHCASLEQPAVPPPRAG